MAEISKSKYRLWSLIFQALIPITVALVGWWVQTTVSTVNVAQEYTQIAADILRQDPETTDSNLRLWAVDVIDNMAPVSLSEATRESLLKAVIVVPRMRIVMPTPPEWYLEPPMRIPDGPVTYGELLMDYAAVRPKLKGLQTWVSQMQEIYPSVDSLEQQIAEELEMLEKQISESERRSEILEEELRDTIAN